MTPRRELHTREMDEEHLQSLKVNTQRLMEDIHYTSRWGTGEKWGEYGSPFFNLSQAQRLIMCAGNPPKRACPASPSRTPTRKPEIGSFMPLKLWVAM